MSPGASRIENNGTGSQVQVNQRGRGASSDEKGSASPCLGIPIRGSTVNDHRTLLQAFVIKKATRPPPPAPPELERKRLPGSRGSIPEACPPLPKDFPCLRYSGQPADRASRTSSTREIGSLIRVDQNGTAVHRNVDPAFYDQFPCGDDFQRSTAGCGFPRFPTPPPEPPMRNERSAEP